MTKDLKFELVVKEILVGLGLGLLGVVLFSLVDPWGDLFYSIMFGSITWYIFMWTGIGITGYLTLKKLGRQREFFELFSLSFLGLVVAVVIYATLVSLTFKLIPYRLSSFIMPIVLPLTGAIIGFNYRLKKPVTKDTQTTDNDSTSVKN
jgi:uncharacterized protein YacL